MGPPDPSEARLRPFTRRDLSGVLVLEQLSFGADAYSRRDFLELACSDDGIFTVAESGDQIVGYAVGTMFGPEGYIVSIAVHPERRRLGLGRQLMEAMLGALREAGTTQVALHVSIHNTAAIRLYESLGFRTVMIVPQYYADGSPAKVMFLHQNG